jgi:protein gp37
MADRSAIEWTEATWNPVTGCSKVSPGCAHCDAETFAERWRGTPGHPYEQGFDLRLWPGRLEQPLRWVRPRMIFVNPMSDLFHEDIPADVIGQVFEVMLRADQHTFQVLTKWHERLLELAPDLCWPDNVWMGVSIENRRFVHRADALRQVPAAVRFISAEPLLGPLDGLDLSGIDWLICGGESGPRHRPVKIEWIRDLRDRCNAEDVAFFFKQWGGRRPKSRGRELDGRTWDAMPARERDRRVALRSRTMDPRLFEPEDVLSKDVLDADAQAAEDPRIGVPQDDLDAARMWRSPGDGLLVRGVKPHSAYKSRLVSRGIGTVSQAMAGQWFARQHGLEYVELYSGPGRLLDESTGLELVGSPVQALEVARPFTRYVFSDYSQDCVDALRARVGERENVHVLRGDANDRAHLDEVTALLNPRALVVAYLDPARPQDLRWTTVDFLASQFRFIDLIINLPAIA